MKRDSWFGGTWKGSGNEQYQHYAHFGPREACIVAGASIEAALADLLRTRLCGRAGEVEKFLGLDGTLDAPAGSLGGRIRLAEVVGVIDEGIAQTLRALMELRNLMAHRAHVSLLDADAQRHIDRLRQRLHTGDEADRNELAAQLEATKTEGEDAHRFVCFMFASIEHELARRLEHLKPIEAVSVPAEWQTGDEQHGPKG